MLLLSTGLFLQNVTAATGLTLKWQASPSSPDIDGYRVYYGISSGNYAQHVDVAGTATIATVANAGAFAAHLLAAWHQAGELLGGGVDQILHARERRKISRQCAIDSLAMRGQERVA